MSDTTTYDLERMAAGEIETPGALEEQVAALRADDSEILREYPPERFVPELQASVSRPAPSLKVPIVLALAGLVVALVLIQPGEVAPRVERGVPGVRLKGPELRLHLYKQDPAGEVRLSAGDAISAGDVVQAKFGLATESFVALFSIDGAGVVTAVEPTDLEATAPRYAGGTHAAPRSTELDDAPDFERFVVVACPEAFRPAEVVAKVQAHLDLEPCSVETLELRKR